MLLLLLEEGRTEGGVGAHQNFCGELGTFTALKGGCMNDTVVVIFNRVLGDGVLLECAAHEVGGGVLITLCDHLVSKEVREHTSCRHSRNVLHSAAQMQYSILVLKAAFVRLSVPAQCALKHVCCAG